MEANFVFSDWDVIISGVEVQMQADGTRHTDEGVERIKIRIRFFNGSQNPELRLRRYNANGVLVENLALRTDCSTYDLFATCYRHVKRMREE
ncbi:hypothetical protein [Porphyromonas somerae]|uniref:hypothetical protein n=1 Tax=Porphyromonas somerae TaxID=322095 RepID=UPI001FCB06BF|nr:hypothetical protein [Porphyromonas somerae]BDE81796.1 hypothetical protein CE91St14_08240 [Porphyromonas somerae]